MKLDILKWIDKHRLLSKVAANNGNWRLKRSGLYNQFVCRFYGFAILKTNKKIFLEDAKKEKKKIQKLIYLKYKYEN